MSSEVGEIYSKYAYSICTDFLSLVVMPFKRCFGLYRRIDSEIATVGGPLVLFSCTLHRILPCVIPRQNNASKGAPCREIPGIPIFFRWPLCLSFFGLYGRVDFKIATAGGPFVFVRMAKRHRISPCVTPRRTNAFEGEPCQACHEGIRAHFELSKTGAMLRQTRNLFFSSYVFFYAFHQRTAHTAV